MNKLIGNCGLTEYTIEEKRELEIGYDFQSLYWGEGLATEAATAVRDYAINVLNEPRLIALVRKTNVASSRVLEKIGMLQEKDLVLRDSNDWLYALESNQQRTRKHRFKKPYGGALRC